MKKAMFLSLSIYLFQYFGIFLSNAQETFQVYYPLGSSSQICSVEPHPNGGYLLAGNGNRDVNTIFLVNLSENGDSLWGKTYRRNELANRWAVDMSITKDQEGYFILTGNTLVGYGNKSYNAVMKTDINGDSIWHTIVSPIHDWSNAPFSEIIATYDGGCLISRLENDRGTITKLNKDGEIVWSFEPNEKSNWHKIVEASDHSIFATGWQYIWRPQGSGSRFSALKLDENGELIWHNIYFSGEVDKGDSIMAHGRDVLPLNDGGCLVVGKVFDPGKWDGGAAYMVRFNENGDSLWSKQFKYGTHPIAWRIIKSNNSGFLMYIDRFFGTGSTPTLIKLDENCDTIWTQTGYDYRLTLERINHDGSLIFKGYGQGAAPIIKTTHDGIYLQPDLVVPLNGSTDIDIPATFKWYERHHKANKFHIQLADNENFSNPSSFLISQGENLSGDAESLIVENLKSFTTYYWRITTLGAEDGHGPWSDVFSFSTKDYTDIIDPEYNTNTILIENHPNPFRIRTTIKFQIKHAGPVSVHVYDLCGKLASTISEGVLAAGAYSYVFQPYDLPAGIYICRLMTPGEQKNIKLVYQP